MAEAVFATSQGVLQSRSDIEALDCTFASTMNEAALRPFLQKEDSENLSPHY